MALGIYLNGTTDAADGTLEVPGDQNGLTLGVIGATATFHMRCPSGYQNAEQVTVTAPTDCEVSTDGVTYGATAVYAVSDIQDTNVACFVKRTAATITTTTWIGLVTTPRLAFVTTFVPDTTAPVLSGTLSALIGDGQVTLNWPDATDAVGVTGYDVEYGTTTGYGSSVSPDPTTSTATITGLTNNTKYYFRVRAHDAAGNVSGWITASATPGLTSFSVDYSDNQSHLPMVAYGDAPPVYAGGRMVLYAASPGVSYAQVDPNSGLLAALKLKEAHTFMTEVACTGSTLTPPKMSVPLDVYYGPGFTSYLRIDAIVRNADASITDFAFVYFDTGGTERFWNGTSWGGRATSYRGTNQLYRFVVETTSTQFRFRILSTSDVSLATSPWVNWSSAKAGYDSGPITFRVLQVEGVTLSVSKISMS